MFGRVKNFLLFISIVVKILFTGVLIFLDKVSGYRNTYTSVLLTLASALFILYTL
jgi:hypothetical protein